MDFNIVLDISSIIWDEADFKANTSQYYKLVNSISMLFYKLDEEKPNILLRDELLNEMRATFPYGKIPYGFSDFEFQTLNFLSNISPITYTDSIKSNIISIPNLIKPYYNDTTKSEVLCLISKIHSDDELENVYFTFEYLWDKNDKLLTKASGKSKVYETIISDNENELEEFFAKFKPAFEHYSKHDKTPYNTKEKWEESDDKDGFISRLSCYNNVDIIEPQRILESRYPKKLGEYYYSYDTVNEVYVIFRFTRLNIYHAYDEYNIERIPNEVKQHFNKWKYKWH